MEWGPRALGNRSILCDPRRADMKALLNAKIKRRESFRPFAPSVLEEAVAEWFKEDDAVPFMMQVFQIREEKRSLIPAVTHVDGSGRLQTVSVQANPLYHRLIREFQQLTGIPMVLNTSFNENEPVVCTPQEALDCFLRTSMDTLVLGNVMISRAAKS
jgi:carbamoyltransferase